MPSPVPDRETAGVGDDHFCHFVESCLGLGTEGWEDSVCMNHWVRKEEKEQQPNPWHRVDLYPQV
jgi:hypothetical protein